MASLNDTYMAFDPRDAAHSLADYANQIPWLARQTRDACAPISRRDLTQRLTALGMTMSPNRAAAEATMWLHEMTRLLSDLPKDILFDAVDECQRQNKFLPSIAEIRAIADPLFAERKTNAARLEVIARIQAEPVTPKQEQLSRKLCTADQAETALKDYGLLDAVRGKEAVRIDRGPPRKPTRQDYLEMGVDPAVLDQMEINQGERA